MRTRAEIKFIGMADAVDANIPVRMLRDDYAWSEKSATYRTRENPDFVAAVERLLDIRGLDRHSPIILMCQSGSRVPIAARLLHLAGFREVYAQYRVSRDSRQNRDQAWASASSTAGKTRIFPGVINSTPAKCTLIAHPERFYA